MAISLEKGQKLSLSKEVPGLKDVLVGLGWDTNKFDTGAEFDLDASAFMLDDTGKCPSTDEFIFYNQPKHKSGAVATAGDNRTGAGDGDDEQITIDLSKMPSNVTKIAITCTIHDAEARKQNFGQVENAYVRIVDQASGKEICRYDLGEDFSIESAVVFGELYLHGGEWKFAAVGTGFNGGLGALCANYGINL